MSPTWVATLRQLSPQLMYLLLIAEDNGEMTASIAKKDSYCQIS